MAWICSNNPKHIFENPTPDYFCDKCEPFTGILVEGDIEKTVDEGGTIPVVDKGKEREVGLCILLMDASGSMTHKPFKGSPLSRMELVATSAAAGIFDLKQLSNKDNAYIAAFKFDHRVERMFIDTVGGLLKKYNEDIKAFADDILQHLKSMQGQTNINGALKTAFSFADQFVNKKMAHFQDYRPVKQNILKKDMSSITVPNVRVLMYTDGMHWTGGSSKLEDNPFKALSENIPVDILIGAFFGDANYEGCDDLKGLLSHCPKHGEQQFFLFDTPEKYGSLRHLFKMASGASGFCPKCIEEFENEFTGKI